MIGPERTLTAQIVLGLSMAVVGICVYMAWRQFVLLWHTRKPWDAWFLLIYAGLANTVGLVAQSVWGASRVLFSWRAGSYCVGLVAIGTGVLGAAFSVGRRDKRASDTDPTTPTGGEEGSMSFGKFLTTPLGSALRVFVGVVLGYLVLDLQSSGTISLNVDKVTTWAAAALVVAVPILIAAINPADTRFGKGS